MYTIQDITKNFRSEMREEFTSFRLAVKQEFVDFRSEMKRGIAGIRSDMREFEFRMTIRLGSLMIVLAGIVVAFNKFL